MKRPHSKRASKNIGDLHGEKAPDQRPRKRRPLSKGLRTRAGGNHGNGKKFEKGQNSHTREVFRRGPDLIPRGNGTLMLRCVFHDARERIYDNLLRFATGKPRDTAAFMDMYIDRTEGRPVKKVESSERQFTSVFVLTDKDGQLQPALTPRQSVGAGASPAASELSAEDALILLLGQNGGHGEEGARP